MENPDSVLQQRGRDMQLYDELLRDDQVKPCFQQRRLAATQSEWDVEPASEKCFFFLGGCWVIIQDSRPEMGFLY